MAIGGLGAGILGGALGGGLAVTVLAPLTAANNFLGSYFFGSGMILGERQMYQDDWIKIKKRLDAGESFLVILEEVMKPNTQAIMQMARETVIAVSKEWNDIVLAYLQSIPQSLWDVINKISAGEGNPLLDEGLSDLANGISGYINGVVQCAPGWSRVNNICTKNKPSPDTAADAQEEAEKKKIADDNAKKTLINFANITWDQKIVGSGLSRTQLQSAIKIHEANVVKADKQIALLKKSPLSQNINKSIGNWTNLRKVWFNVLQQYRLALTWVLRNNKSTP